MREYTYSGIAYRQGGDDRTPWLVSFVLPAEELLEWASIPRRTEQHAAGFQRVDDPIRVAKAKEFFAQPENISPTAVVVGLHQAPLPHEIDFVLAGDPAGLGSHPIVDCSLTIRLADESDLLSVASALASRLSSRIPEESEDLGGADTDEIEARVDSDGVEDAYGDEDEEEDEEEDDVDGVEVAHSMLSLLIEQLQDDGWVQDNAETVIDLAKPATIIDGQHRLKGAELLETDLPFAVCAIVDCPWSEQVFQFTVVNYTAKGIPDQFITANAALSLTESELQTLNSRLVQAGVKVIEYELMRTVQWDDQSPFHELVNLSEKAQDGKIGYKTMVRIAKRWYAASGPVFKDMLLPNLFPEISGAGKVTKRREAWQAGPWADFFKEFWNAVHRHYRNEPSHEPGHTLWDVGHSQLMIAAVLLEYQESFLANLNAQDEDYFEVPEGSDPLQYLLGRINKRAETFADFNPPAVFQTPWAMSSLNTGAGRAVLQDLLRKLRESKGNYSHGGHPIVTGNVAGGLGN